MAISIRQAKPATKQVTSLEEVKKQILAAAAKADAAAPTELTVTLDQGRYTLTEPFVLSAEEHPGLANIRLTVKAKESMRPIISGIQFLAGKDFTPVEGTPYYTYQLPKGKKGYPKFHDLFLGDKRIPMAKSPVWRNPFPLLPEERRGEKTLEGLYAPIAYLKKVKENGIHATEIRMYVQWEHYTLRVKDVDLTVTKEVNGEPYGLITFYEEFDEYFVRHMHTCNNVGNRETFFINNTAFLTEPNTYTYDWHTGVITLLPASPDLMRTLRVGYATFGNLFSFKGMTGVTVEGLNFVGSTSPYVCESGYFGRLSNNEMRAGRLRDYAVVSSNNHNFTVRDCAFYALGGGGVQLCDRTVRAEITGCRFVDVAMGAVSIGNYRVGKGWLDYENQTYRVKVTNNYFEHIAYDYPSTACIFLGFCDGAEISHNTVRGCGYSAIAAGDGYSKVGFEIGERINLRGVEIAYNDIRNFMDVCRDGGAVYVTGANCVVDYAPRFNSIHHNYAALDDIKDHDRRGYYLDGAASNWDVNDNVIDNCALPLFTQYHVPEQYTHHNRVWNFYSTTWVDPDGNHKPHHDTLLGFYAVEKDLATLLTKHPHAKEIMDGAGCDAAVSYER